MGCQRKAFLSWGGPQCKGPKSGLALFKEGQNQNGFSGLRVRLGSEIRRNGRGQTDWCLTGPLRILVHWNPQRLFRVITSSDFSLQGFGFCVENRLGIRAEAGRSLRSFQSTAGDVPGLDPGLSGGAPEREESGRLLKVELTEFAGHFHMGLKEGDDSYQEGFQDFSLGW